MKENILLTTLLQSKRFVKENSPVTFPAPAEILTPFITAIEPLPIEGQWHVQVQNPVVNMNVDGSENIAYPRMLIEKRFKIVESEENPFNLNNTFTIGLLCALDIQNPSLKLYQGIVASACTNLSIFRAEDIRSINLLGDFESVPRLTEEFANKMANTVSVYKDINDMLETTELDDGYLVDQLLGRLINTATRKSNPIPTSAIINAAKLLQDRNSKYYWNQKKSLPIAQVYQAVTQGITDSPEIFSKPEKTLAVSKAIYDWGIGHVINHN